MAGEAGQGTGQGAGGRAYRAIPGPSVIPDRVLNAMHRAAPDIYSRDMDGLAAGLARDLKALAGCSGHVAMYISNGHGVWEAAGANLFSPGDRALVLATGNFGHGWAEVMRGLGVAVELIDFGRSAPVDPGRVEEALAADAAHAIRVVAVVQTDTSAAVRNDIAAVRAAIGRAGHPALLAVDGVCSFGCERFEFDAMGADVFVSACQKGLMVPPGLGFVFFSDRAAGAGRGARCRTRATDWTPRAWPEEFWHYWFGTAPTHHLWGLRAALDMIAEEGRERVWARHERIARAWWAAFECWGGAGPLRLNIADPAFRSHAVTAARIGAPHGTALREWVAAHCGLTLGVGLGMAPPGDPAWHGFFRVGHMGHVNAHMALGAVASVEAGLTALGIPHAPGGTAAAAAVIAAG